LNKAGLASGILATIIILFVFALFSLIALAGWNYVNTTFQSMDNETVSPTVKAEINSLSNFMGWGDTIFVFFFIALLIGFMVTSFTISTDKTIYIALYFVFLIFSSIIAMVVSNGWAYLTEFSFLTAAAADLPFTDWFMTYLPTISFFMGLIGGVIFYARKKNEPTGNPFNVDFEGGDNP